MRSVSFLLSLLVHVALAASAVYMAHVAPTTIDLGQPVVMVDLVTLQPKGKPAGKPESPKVAAPEPEPEPEPAPEPEPEPVPVKPEPVKVVPKPEPVVKKPAPPAPTVVKPKPKPPKPQDKQISQKKTPEAKPKPKPPKPEPTPKELLNQALATAKDDAKRKAEEKKRKEEEAKRKAEEKKRKAREAAKRKAQAERDALQRELAALQRDVSKEDEEKETGGGDGGEGGVPAGSSLVDVYTGIVMQTVKQNWTYPNVGGRSILTVSVRLHLDKSGEILDYALVRSSGRPDFDASALKAVAVTRQLPPPPTQELEMITINFNQQELY